MVDVRAGRNGMSIFTFDLGGRLEIRPYYENQEIVLSELWLLYQPSGMVFTLRSDGTYSNHMGNDKSGETWFQLEEISGKK